jgi:hypothetical protein
VPYFTPAWTCPRLVFILKTFFDYYGSVESVIVDEAGDDIRYFWCYYILVYSFATKARTKRGND